MKLTRDDFNKEYNKWYYSDDVIQTIKNKTETIDDAYEFYSNDFYYVVKNGDKKLYEVKNPVVSIGSFRCDASVDYLLLTGDEDVNISVELVGKNYKQ